MKFARSEIALGPARMAADAATMDSQWQDLSTAISDELSDFGEHQRIPAACSVAGAR